MKGIRSIRDWVRWGASSFNAAGLCFGHGTDNALDESLALVLHALHLDHTLPEAFLDARLTPDEAAAVERLLRKRIKRRLPVAYLTGKARFAELEFEVTPDVLVPRSPIAELILQGFSPWLDRQPVERILEIGTGSGCIAIACAHAFPEATVDAVDVSPQALELAARNVAAHRVETSVRLIESDVYAALDSSRYDLIVSNPPYVDLEEMAQLPPEYQREPALGLAGGKDGLDIARRILGGAAGRLRAGGLLVIEVGSSARHLVAAYPDVPFLWPEFEFGGDGVMMLTAEDVATWFGSGAAASGQDADGGSQ